MSSLKSRSDVCLVTSTTEDYLAGTVALLGSFAKHHPSFDGDVVVFEDGLSEDAKRLLYSAFDGLRFMPVAPELLCRVARLQAELPQLRVDAPLFYTLDAFRLVGRYRKVLHCDSDMLFLAPVDELFDAPEPLICCGDMETARGHCRDVETMEGIERSAANDRQVVEHPFNCGFLLLDGQLAAERPYQKLLATMVAEQWRKLSPRVPLADQPILNRYFNGRQTLVSWTYNYLVPHGPEIRAREGIGAPQAKLLHFKGRVKPWRPQAALHWAQGAGVHGMAPAFKLWHNAYMDFLAENRQRDSTTLVHVDVPPVPASPGGSRAIGDSAFSYMARQRVHFGAEHDLAAAIDTHLFGVAPNSSGSTFLKLALATSHRTWNLVREGARATGFAGPQSWRGGAGAPATKLLWASEQRWMDLFLNGRFDWPRTRKAWYFQAFSLDPEAPVFYTKTPEHLLLLPQLVRHFANVKFLFMVRDPYAVCEGISRSYRAFYGMDAYRALQPPAGRSVEAAAAHHIVNCLIWQRRNIDAFGSRGTFFTYETMCDEPAQVAAQIRRLVPAIDDLDLEQRLMAKRYDEGLTNMNARQIESLTAAQLADVNSVLEPNREVIEHFGYALR